MSNYTKAKRWIRLSLSSGLYRRPCSIVLNDVVADDSEGRHDEGSRRSGGFIPKGVLLTTNLRVQTEGRDVGGGNKCLSRVITIRD